MQAETVSSQAARDDVDTVDTHGFAFYQDVLKDTLERDHLGAVVAIHLDSSDYAIGRYPLEAARALRAKQPKGMMFITRIGPPTVADLSVVDRMDNPIK